MCQLKQQKTSIDNEHFYGQITYLNAQKLLYPVNIRLSISRQFLICHPETIQHGQTLILFAKLKPSYNFANKGTFNYKTWLLSKGVSTTGYINTQKVISVADGSLSTRYQWYQQFEQLVEEEPLRAILFALTFGERASFNDETWQVLRQTGTQHLIAISGLHIGLVAAFAYLFLRLCIRTFPLSRLLRNQGLPTNVSNALLSANAQPLLLLIAGFTALFYGYLANFSTPTTRALVMLFLVLIARSCYLHLSFYG